jgi:hypothetical protein
MPRSIDHVGLLAISVALLAGWTAPTALAAEFPLGAKVMAYDAALEKKVVPKAGAPALAAVIDLSSQFPPIGNQSPYNSCVGWAVGYNMKTQQEQVERAWGVTTTAHQFSALWIYNQIRIGLDDGAYVEHALNLLVSKGCDTRNNFSPSNLTILPGAASFANAEQYHVLSWNYLSRDAVSIKSELSQGRPVVIVIAIYPDFDNLSAANPIFNVVSGALRGYHAICLLGYDDAKSAFKFANSWGTGWGINGYGWISYALTASPAVVSAAYVSTDLVPSVLPVVSVSMTAGSEWSTEYTNRTGAFTISRPASDVGSSLTVAYTFAGSAVKGTHYTVNPESPIVLEPGLASKTVTVTPITTTGYEAPSTIQLNVATNPGYTIGTGSATMARHDQDLQLTGAIPAGTYPGNAVPFNYRQVRFVGTASVPSGVVTTNAQDTIVLAAGASATTTVASGATLSLTAKTLISMLPGTTISQGASFSARIQ